MPLQLPEDRIAALRDAEQRAKDLKADLQAAKRAGIDVGDLEEQLDRLEAMRSGLLSEFGPRTRTRARE